MTATTYSHVFVVCPNCSKDSGCRIDHLFESGSQWGPKWGPWSCRECGVNIQGIVNSEVRTTTAEVSERQDRRYASKALALLRLRSPDGDVYFVMDHGSVYTGGAGQRSSPEEEQASMRYFYEEHSCPTKRYFYEEHSCPTKRYFYEEHSCPTNWLDECVAVIQNGDMDPHGFLEFVRFIEVPRDSDLDQDPWQELFPEAFAATGETV